VLYCVKIPFRTGSGYSAGTATAAQFTASLGKITIPYSAALNPATFTFAAWVYATGSTGDYQSIITSRQDSSPAKGFVLYITPAGSWEFWGARSSGSWGTVSGGNVSFGAWTHVALTRNASGTNRIFINGVQIASANFTFTPNTTYPLHLGAGNSDGGAYRFNGKIDDATFWNTALDAALIQQHRDGTGGSFPTPAYGGHYHTHVQAALETVNPGLYARYSFSVADPATLSSLTLRLKYDDALVAYLNGSEIVRRNFAGTRSYNSVADTDRSDTEAVVWDSADLTAAALPLLVTGQNTLAIHAMRRSLTHSAFLLNPELTATYTSAVTTGYFATATPGLTNSAFTAPGPDLTEITHSPAEPLPTQALTVTARVRPRLAAIQSVRLIPRVQYNAEGSPIAMTDAGPVVGATDGSRWFTATLPNAGGAAARQMFRYYISSSDTAARSWRSPIVTDTTNDDGKSQSPQYHGTVVRDATLTAGMPILQWFTQDVPNSDARTGSRASAFYQGNFYDNIYVRQRGGYTSYGSQKFNFNRGYGIFVNDTLGTVGEVNMNSAGADSSYLRPLLAFDCWRQAGHEASHAHLVALYRNGSYQRMSSMIEQVDEDFLNRNNLDEEGALYKLVQRVGETPNGNDYSNNPALGDTLYGIEKKTRQYENFADLDTFVAGINQTDSAARNAFLFRHLNIPSFVNAMAVRNLTGEGDMNRKNFYLHRDSNHSGEWRLFPWDKDFTFGVSYSSTVANPWQASQTYYHDPGGTNQWCVLFEAGLNNPQLRQMVARRIRHLADDILGPIGTAYNTTVVESRLETIRAGMLPLPPGVATPSGYNSRGGIDSWLVTHRNNTYTTYGPTGSYQLVAAAPTRLPQAAILSADALPATGTEQDHEHLRLSNPTAEAVDMSGWTLWNPGKSTPFHTFAAGTIIPGNTLAPLHQPYVVRNIPAFRSRPGAGAIEYVLGEYSGQLSARGETIELRAGQLATSRFVSSFTTPAAPTAAQQFLRLTELMFAPTSPSPAELAAAPGTAASDYEFIELRNTGATDLDLTNCRFTDGVEFTFPALVLSPGERVLVVANATGFAARYGNGRLISGEFTGNLDNAGEHLRIEDAVGEMVLDFSYNPRWFPPAAGGGRSLVVRDENPAYSTYDQPTHWAISGTAGGTPGATDPLGFAHHFDGWRWNHFPAAQIYLPSPPNPAGTVNAALVGPAADADGDGLPNLTEYAFGRSPNQPELSSLTAIELASEPAGACIRISYQRRIQALDLTFIVEACDDLAAGSWSAVSLPETVEPISADLERVTLRDADFADSARQFYRVRVVKP
jgi:hypothetical protein